MKIEIIEALIDTVERVTDLENVYNDKTGESFSWQEIKEALHFLKDLKN
jgi:hypothetical protein